VKFVATKKGMTPNFFRPSFLLLFLDLGSEIRDSGSGLGKNQDPGSTILERRIIAAIILLDPAGYLTAKTFFLASLTSFWSNNDLTIGVQFLLSQFYFRWPKYFAYLQELV
jgi:hypothetical protein